MRAAYSLCAEQKGEHERFAFTLYWRRQDLTISGALPSERLEDDPGPPVSSDDDYTLAPSGDDEAVTVRRSSPPGGQVSTSRRDSRSDADRLELLYRDARTPSGDGRLRLDEQRFAASLAAAGLELQVQQELLTLARQADEAGRDRLFEERSISELIASTLNGAA